MKKRLKIPKGGNHIQEIEGQTIQCPKEKGQTMMYKTLHRKLKIFINKLTYCPEGGKAPTNS